jgi:hypothetical protein
MTMRRVLRALAISSLTLLVLLEASAEKHAQTQGGPYRSSTPPSSLRWIVLQQ